MHLLQAIIKYKLSLFLPGEPILTFINIFKFQWQSLKSLYLVKLLLYSTFPFIKVTCELFTHVSVKIATNANVFIL